MVPESMIRNCPRDCPNIRVHRFHQVRILLMRLGDPREAHKVPVEVVPLQAYVVAREKDRERNQRSREYRGLAFPPGARWGLRVREVY